MTGGKSGHAGNTGSGQGAGGSQQQPQKPSPPPMQELMKGGSPK